MRSWARMACMALLGLIGAYGSQALGCSRRSIKQNVGSLILPVSIFAAMKQKVMKYIFGKQNYFEARSLKAHEL